MKQPSVYLLASGRNGTLYVGVTSDLAKRVWLHKENLVDGFTKRYGVHTLVWYEPHETMESAIGREKTIKAWKRRWKLELIEKANPEWRGPVRGAGVTEPGFRRAAGMTISPSSPQRKLGSRLRPRSNAAWRDRGC